MRSAFSADASESTPPAASLSPLRVGIVGAGGIAAKLHLPEMATVENARVTLLAGRKATRLETLCRKFDVPDWTRDYDAVIADPRIDAVIVALPHPLHVRYGLAALAAGKHVLMQKPLSTSLREADEFVQAAERSDRTVLALPYVARPHVLAARERVAAGALGVVSSAHARFSHGGPEVYYATIQAILEEEPEEDLWFFDAAKADVGALFDMGVYAVAHLAAILGSVKSVSCRCATAAKPTQLEDTAAMILEFAGGTLATAETGWCDGARTSEFSIHGAPGKLVNPSLTTELWHWKPKSLVDEDAPLEGERVPTDRFPLQNAHQHWADCIRAGIPPPIAHARFARHVTEILLCALESSRSGKWVDVDSRTEPAAPL